MSFLAPFCDSGQVDRGDVLSEKRKSRRFTRRLRVHFGEKNRPFSHTGLTADISATGMFIGTTAQVKPGTRIHAEVSVADDSSLYFEGVVARQVIVPPELRSVMKAGFGMRFLSAIDLLSELVPVLKERSQLVVSYASAAQLREAWNKELKHGGAFVWLENPHPLNSVVSVEVDLPFVGKKLPFEARIVHIAPEHNGKHGVAFMFLDVPGLSAAITSAMT